MQRAPKQQLKVDFSKVVCLLCAQSILFNPFIFIFPLKKERNSQLNMSWIREGELTIIERFCANIIKVRMGLGGFCGKEQAGSSGWNCLCGCSALEREHCWQGYI